MAEENLKARASGPADDSPGNQRSEKESRGEGAQGKRPPRHPIFVRSQGNFDFLSMVNDLKNRTECRNQSYFPWKKRLNAKWGAKWSNRALFLTRIGPRREQLCNFFLGHDATCYSFRNVKYRLRFICYFLSSITPRHKHPCNTTSQKPHWIDKICL